MKAILLVAACEMGFRLAWAAPLIVAVPENTEIPAAQSTGLAEQEFAQPAIDWDAVDPPRGVEGVPTEAPRWNTEDFGVNEPSGGSVNSQPVLQADGIPGIFKLLSEPATVGVGMLAVIGCMLVQRRWRTLIRHVRIVSRRGRATVILRKFG